MAVCERIHTFFSTFLLTDGKSIAVNHSSLVNTEIVNYSRSSVMSHEIHFFLDPSLPDIRYRTLDELLYQYCQGRPETIMGDSYVFLITDIQPGHYLECYIYLTSPLSWHFILKGYELRESFILYLKDMCQALKIGYAEPTKRIHFTGSSDNQALKKLRS